MLLISNFEFVEQLLKIFRFPLVSAKKLKIVYFNLSMKRLFRIIVSFSLFLLISFKLIAQQDHFIYIQTENSQAFYVKIDKKIISSSASGYVIVSKLMEGIYHLSIGFPKKEMEEQNFVCSVDKKDKGYSLKNFGEKGWGLFNLQSMEITMAGTKTASSPDIKETKDDAFSNMLSTVVNDPGIRQKEILTEESKVEMKGEAKTEKKDESLIDEKKGLIKKTSTDESHVTISGVTPTQAISKIFSNTNDKGVEMVFVDKSYINQDTIRIFIATDKTVAPVQSITKIEVLKQEEPKKDTLVKIEPGKDEKIAEPVKMEEKKEEKKELSKKDDKFLDIVLPNSNNPKEPIAKEEKTKELSTTEKLKEENKKLPVMINSDCRNFASEEDFLKLRKKMAAIIGDDDMIHTSKKIFKNKCFTTEQIKNLSVLFLKDEGKYKFFDAAYPFISDSNNFSSLESQLSDPYFISRFKVMIRH